MTRVRLDRGSYCVVERFCFVFDERIAFIENVTLDVVDSSKSNHNVIIIIVVRDLT